MHRATLFLLVVLLVVQVSCSYTQEEVSGLMENANRFNDAMKTLYPGDIGKQFTNIRLNGSTHKISTRCSEQVTLYQGGLKNGTFWALQMIDASSKIPSGILMGNQRDLGVYDECVAINVIEGTEWIRGRHCMYNIVVNLGAIPVSEILSICMPELCEPNDVQQILKSTFEKISADMDVSISGVMCSSVHSRKWTTGGILTLLVLFL